MYAQLINSYTDIECVSIMSNHDSHDAMKVVMNKLAILLNVKHNFDIIIKYGSTYNTRIS